jgi:hypothetical protein
MIARIRSSRRWLCIALALTASASLLGLAGGNDDCTGGDISLGRCVRVVPVQIISDEKIAFIMRYRIALQKVSTDVEVSLELPDCVVAPALVVESCNGPSGALHLSYDSGDESFRVEGHQQIVIIRGQSGWTCYGEPIKNGSWRVLFIRSRLSSGEDNPECVARAERWSSGKLIEKWNLMNAEYIEQVAAHSDKGAAHKGDPYYQVASQLSGMWKVENHSAFSRLSRHKGNNKMQFTLPVRRLLNDLELSEAGLHRKMNSYPILKGRGTEILLLFGSVPPSRQRADYKNGSISFTIEDGIGCLKPMWVLFTDAQAYCGYANDEDSPYIPLGSPLPKR